MEVLVLQVYIYDKTDQTEQFKYLYYCVSVVTEENYIQKTDGGRRS